MANRILRFRCSIGSRCQRKGCDNAGARAREEVDSSFYWFVLVDGGTNTDMKNRCRFVNGGRLLSVHLPVLLMIVRATTVADGGFGLVKFYVMWRGLFVCPWLSAGVRLKRLKHYQTLPNIFAGFGRKLLSKPRALPATFDRASARDRETIVVCSSQQTPGRAPWQCGLNWNRLELPK